MCTSHILSYFSLSFKASWLWGKVTLSDKSTNLGVWTPYSWFSSLSNGYKFKAENWGAIVTDVTSAADYGTAQVAPSTESILTKLFDRGYGYVYLTTESLFNTTSSQLDSLIMGIHKKTAGETWPSGKRRLSAVDDGVAARAFECDDTLSRKQHGA